MRVLFSIFHTFFTYLIMALALSIFIPFDNIQPSYAGMFVTCIIGMWIACGAIFNIFMSLIGSYDDDFSPISIAFKMLTYGTLVNVSGPFGYFFIDHKFSKLSD